MPVRLETSKSPLCIICGVLIPYRLYNSSPEGRYRAIRCDNDSRIDGKPFITGIANSVPNHIKTCAAPSDPREVLRNFSDLLTDEDSFPALIGTQERPQPGFLFHDSCWRILREALVPYTVPIQTLYDLCLSCPVSGAAEALDWGHDYGGVVNMLPRARYPWQDVYIDSLNNTTTTIFRQEGYSVKEIVRAYSIARELEVPSMTISTVSPIFTGTPDCFYRLPQEIREYILIALPSSSVRNLRKASRSFASLALVRQFWASRFEYDKDRGYCYIVNKVLHSWGGAEARRSINWKVMYQLTGSPKAPSWQFLSRKRIWGFSQDLIRLLTERPLANRNLTRSLQMDPGDPTMPWTSVGGDLTPRAAFPFGMKCRVIYKQIILTRYPVRKIGVSFRELNGIQYISGMRFFPGTKDPVILGYVLPSREKFIDFEGRCHNLIGFIIATAPRGIVALRAITQQGATSNWVGSHERFPKTLRLCMKSPIQILKGCFDGFKMVSLSVPPDVEPLFSENTDDHHLHHLWSKGLWYPGPPHPSFHLYDTLIAERHIPIYEYHPLIPIMFGGPRKGNLLKYLTRIAVTTLRSAIVDIEFFYNQDSPQQHLRACPSFASDSDADKLFFDIDGPGGERLTSFEVEGAFFCDQPTGLKKSYKVTAIKISTNKRSHPHSLKPSVLPNLRIPPAPYLSKKQERRNIPPGETLTGIYIMHDSLLSILSIGVIYENLFAKDILQSDWLEEEIKTRVVANKKLRGWN